MLVGFGDGNQHCTLQSPSGVWTCFSNPQNSLRLHLCDLLGGLFCAQEGHERRLEAWSQNQHVQRIIHHLQTAQSAPTK